jgi:hypothetical protein
MHPRPGRHGPQPPPRHAAGAGSLPSGCASSRAACGCAFGRVGRTVGPARAIPICSRRSYAPAVHGFPGAQLPPHPSTRGGAGTGGRPVARGVCRRGLGRDLNLASPYPGPPTQSATPLHACQQSLRMGVSPCSLHGIGWWRALRTPHVMGRPWVCVMHAPAAGGRRWPAPPGRLGPPCWNATALVVQPPSRICGGHHRGTCMS